MKLARLIAWSLLLTLLSVSSALASRFIDHGDQTVTDTRTGLMWTRNADLPAVPMGVGWQEGLDYVAAMNSANGGAGTFGHNDWRLPALSELQSLVDTSRVAPALPTGHPFLDVVLDEYWSSTVNPNKYAYVFGVEMYSGVTYSGHDYNFGYVWPVRGQINTAAVLTLSPASKDFGTVLPGTSATQPFTVSNSGGANLAVSSIVTTGGTFSLFTVAPGSCGTLNPTIVPGGSCTISVTFTPTTAGAKSTTLRISSNDASTPARDAQLTGAGADTSAPVVTSFTLPATSQRLTVPITSFSASDDLGVTGYCVSETDNPDTCNWSSTVPAEYTFASATPAVKTLYARARDAAGNKGAARSATVTIDIGDRTPPSLTVSTLSDGSRTSNGMLNVAGKAGDPGGITSLSVAGYPVTPNADGTFSQLVVLQAGTTTITTTATDGAGNQAVDSRQITLDTQLPSLEIDTPADNSTTSAGFITVTGTVAMPVAGVEVKVNGGTFESAVVSGSTFSSTVNLAAGLNTIEVAVTDLAGKVNTMKRSVVSDAQGPTVNITSPSQDVRTTISAQTLAGTVADAVPPVSVTVSDGSATYAPQVTGGAFAQTLVLSQSKKYPLVVTVTEGDGSKTTVQRNILFASTRFTVNDDQTVTDNETGLSWTRNANLPTLAVSWQEALDYVAAMNSANGGAGTFGHKDWRLPTVDELYSLVDTNRSFPALPAAHPFSAVQSDEYWSSSVVPNKYAYVYGVSMDYGFKYSGHDYNFGFVWPVRGSQSVTTALEPVVTGSSYSQTLTATKGAAPYTWSVASGGLPAGVTLNPATGALTGTPARSGVYSFTVRAVDGTGVTDTQQYALTVHDVACANSAVRIDGASVVFADIPDAYAHAGDNEVLKLQALDFTSDLLFNRDLRVTLQGGYDCGYTVNAGGAGILGVLRVTSGTVKVEGVRLR